MNKPTNSREAELKSVIRAFIKVCTKTWVTFDNGDSAQISSVNPKLMYRARRAIRRV